MTPSPHTFVTRLGDTEHWAHCQGVSEQIPRQLGSHTTRSTYVGQRGSSKPWLVSVSWLSLVSCVDVTAASTSVSREQLPSSSIHCAQMTKFAFLRTSLIRAVCTNVNVNNKTLQKICCKLKYLVIWMQNYPINMVDPVTRPLKAGSAVWRKVGKINIGGWTGGQAVQCRQGEAVRSPAPAPRVPDATHPPSPPLPAPKIIACIYPLLSPHDSRSLGQGCDDDA